eukprot:8760176-Heterocapsa_arctica.AAC.1
MAAYLYEFLDGDEFAELSSASDSGKPAGGALREGCLRLAGTGDGSLVLPAPGRRRRVCGAQLGLGKRRACRTRSSSRTSKPRRERGGQPTSTSSWTTTSSRSSPRSRRAAGLPDAFFEMDVYASQGEGMAAYCHEFLDELAELSSASLLLQAHAVAPDLRRQAS